MHSPLLLQFIKEAKKLNSSLPILDLACGNGRNGLYCLQNHFPTVFADINKACLQEIKQQITHHQVIYPASLSFFWQVNFEDELQSPLAKNSYLAVIVFRYLHRPLFDQIKASIVDGGFIVYETFTTKQAEFGRPKNPDFLLKEGELLRHFSGWKVLHYFEGIKESDAGNSKQAIAQIIAQKF
ncbi:SAM-dependent methyltransferase [Colwelliaceae bacterium 6441]